MVAIWRLHGVEQAPRDAYAVGTVLTGRSAGCICWFEAGITDSFDPDLARSTAAWAKPTRQAAGRRRASAEDYDSDDRRPVYARAVGAGMPGGITLEDGAPAEYEDERLVEVVAARAGGRAFRVDRAGEQTLTVRALL